MASLTRRRLYYDVESNKLVRAANTSRSTVSSLSDSLGLISGRDTRLELYLVEPDEEGDYIPFNPAGEYGFTFKLQRPNKPPVSGEFYFEYQGVTSEPLDINSSFRDISCAINAMSTVIAAGGVEVISPQSGGDQLIVKRSFDCGGWGSCSGCNEGSNCSQRNIPFGGKLFLQWNELGARDTLTVYSESLLPPSFAIQTTHHAGTTTDKQLTSLAFIEDAVAQIQATDWEEYGPSLLSVTRDTVGSPTAVETQTISISPDPFSGSFSLISGTDKTGLIPINASAELFALRLKEALGSYSFSVSKPSKHSWTVTWNDNGAQNLLAISENSIASSYGMQAVVEWNSELLDILRVSESSVTVDAELTMTEIASGDDQVSYKESVQIQTPLI